MYYQKFNEWTRTWKYFKYKYTILTKVLNIVLTINRGDFSTKPLFYIYMEIWKPVVGYEWLYEVSSLGNVKSLNYNHTGKEKIIKYSSSSKYSLVSLSKDKIVKAQNIHRIVAQAFLWLDINSKLCVCHKDDNPSNNRLDNLFIGTHKENTDDMINKWRWRWWRKWKIIIQYSLEWLEIKEWETAYKASTQLWIVNSQICNCAKWKKWCNTAWWFIWKYKIYE